MLTLNEKTVATDEYLKLVADIPGYNKRYPICVAIGQVYTQLTDDALKLKLRYVLTLAQHITTELDRHDKGWLRNFYPRYRDYQDFEKRML